MRLVSVQVCGSITLMVASSEFSTKIGWVSPPLPEAAGAGVLAAAAVAAPAVAAAATAASALAGRLASGLALSAAAAGLGASGLAATGLGASPAVAAGAWAQAGAMVAPQSNEAAITACPLACEKLETRRRANDFTNIHFQIRPPV